MQLDVVLRTSVNNAVRPWKRIIDVPRDVLVFKCLKSLVNSINEFDEQEIQIKLTVLDDRSSSENLDKIKKYLSECNRDTELISLNTDGYNGQTGSALAQFAYGRDCEGLVYMVEDDYFHSIDSIRRMTESWLYFRSRTDLLDVAIYPYDSTHLYEPENNGMHAPTRLFLINNHYWRTTEKTANTIFLHSNTIKKYWPLFEKLGIEFPNVTEDHTINRMYNNTVTTGGPVSLFSPVPSLAVHVSYNMPGIINTNFIDWPKRFEELSL